MDPIVVVGIVIIVLLVVVVVALAIIVSVLISRDKHREEGFQYIVAETINSAFKHETRRLAKMYAEEQRTAKWVKELSKKGELDISKIATETEKRAYILALKKADDAVMLAETNLENIRQELRKAQKRLFSQTEHEKMFKQTKRVIAYLSKQEEAAEERVKVMRERLLVLTSTLSSGNLDAILDDFATTTAAETTPAGVVIPEQTESLVPKTDIETEGDVDRHEHPKF